VWEKKNLRPKTESGIIEGTVPCRKKNTHAEIVFTANGVPTSAAKYAGAESRETCVIIKETQKSPSVIARPERSRDD
jgi:hypothetical protein